MYMYLQKKLLSKQFLLYAHYCFSVDHVPIVLLLIHLGLLVQNLFHLYIISGRHRNDRWSFF